MAGITKSMATTSGWSLVQCDYRNWIHQVRQRRVASERRRWRPQPVHGGCDVQDRTRASIARMRQQHFFPSVDAAARRTVELRRGASASLQHSSCNNTKDNMCDRPADLIADYQIRRGCGRMCNWHPGAGDYHDCFKFPIGAEGG